MNSSSKMPIGTLCWSLPIKNCITGSKLAKNKSTPCAACYGKGGNFRFSAVQNALQKNLDEYHANPIAWGGKIVSEINRNGCKLFRWFVIGDLQSLEMLTIIVSIALQTPETKHWMPTQERKILAEFFKNGGILPSNLFVRISSTKMDKAQPSQSGLASVVTTTEENTSKIAEQGYFICPAKISQGGKCQQCIRCWSRANIIYPLHVSNAVYPKKWRQNE